MPESVTRSPVELLWTAKNKKQLHPSGFDTGGVMRPKETERRQCSTRQVQNPQRPAKKEKRFCSPQKPTLLQPTVAGPQRLTQHQQIVHRLIQGQGDLRRGPALNDVFIQTARTLSEGDESCSWPTSLELEQMARDAEEAQGCSEGLP